MWKEEWAQQGIGRQDVHFNLPIQGKSWVIHSRALTPLIFSCYYNNYKQKQTKTLLRFLLKLQWNNRPDPSAILPLLTDTHSSQSSYRVRLRSHNNIITNRVIADKLPVTWSRLPPSVEHDIPSITIQHYTLPFHLYHTLGSLFHLCPRWALKSQMSEAGLQPDT